MDYSQRVHAIQSALKQHGLDAWLLCDFHNRDPISYRVLGLEEGKFTSRRWFYLVPAVGEPIRLVHAVEKGKLDLLPGKKVVYLPWEQLHRELAGALQGCGRVAMQYSPNNAIPYVDLADPGIVELVRSLGHEVVSSANLVQQFEAILDHEQLESHKEAGRRIQPIKDEAFALIHKALKDGEEITEYDVQQFIIRRFQEEGLNCDAEWPIVAVNEHAADPHFEPRPGKSSVIRKGDGILIDLWARLDDPRAVYYDITWCGFAGTQPPDKYKHIFELGVRARDAALDLVKTRFAQGEPVHGFEVDRACREVIEKAGYAKAFVHRTGHSIGHAVHGNGVHMDSLETRDERLLVPGICFSIEPGIYLEGEMGIRTEIDVFIAPDGEVIVEGERQMSLILMEL